MAKYYVQIKISPVFIAETWNSIPKHLVCALKNLPLWQNDAERLQSTLQSIKMWATLNTLGQLLRFHRSGNLILFRYMLKQIGLLCWHVNIRYFMILVEPSNVVISYCIVVLVLRQFWWSRIEDLHYMYQEHIQRGFK